jgi:hypothetical protein
VAHCTKHHHHTPPSTQSLSLSDDQLLLLPQPLRNLKRNLQRLGHDPRRRESQPLRERNVYDAIALVDFDPLQRFVGGRVLDVVAGVVGEDGGVAGGEVEGAGCGLCEERRGLVSLGGVGDGNGDGDMGRWGRRVWVDGQLTFPTKAVARAEPERK